MINGYVTYNELKIITGYSDRMLNRLLLQGISSHELTTDFYVESKGPKPLKETVFNLLEVEKWLSSHIF